jgi:PAS domain S-box-containing protein
MNYAIISSKDDSPRLNSKLVFQPPENGCPPSFAEACEADVNWNAFSANIGLVFTPPVYPEDEEKTRQTRLLYPLLVGLIFLMALGGFIAVPFIYAEKNINTFLIAASFGIACLSFGLLRLNQVRAAAILLLFGTWPLIALLTFLAGGMQSVVVVFFVVGAVVAGLLLGVRGALAYSLLCCAAGLGLILWESSGHPLPHLFPVPAIAAWVDLAAALLLTTQVMNLSSRDLHQALALTRKRLEERKETESALRESEAKFRRLFETSRDFIFIANTDGRLLAANAAAESRLGYSADELASGRLQSLCYDIRDWEPMRKEILERGYLENYEIRGRRKDGIPIDALVSATLIRDEADRVIGYQGTVKDITIRKRTELTMERQMERLRALHTIEQAITSSMNLETVLNLLTKEIVGQLHMDATAVYLVDEDGQTLSFAAGRGFRAEALRFTDLKFGDGLAGRAAQTRTIVQIPNLSDIQEDPILAKFIDAEGLIAYFGIPLIAKGRLGGILEIFRRSRFEMDSDWPAFLETLAGQAAIAIDNARLMALTRTNLTETETLYRINQDLAASADPPQMMRDVVTLLQKAFDYFYVQIYIRDPETGDFVVRADSGKIGQRILDQGYHVPPGEGIIGYVAETGLPFFTNDVDEVAFRIQDPLLPETKSQLVVPIRTGGQLLGVLDIHQVPPAVLSRHDVQLVGAVADQLALALHKAQLYADLQNALRQEQETRARLIHSEKLAVTGRLLASVSHELNNPLQAIQNALFLLKDEKTISKQAREDLGLVLAETERMAALLDRLRTTYQPVRREDFRPVQLNDIIRDVQALFNTQLRHARISFAFDADPALPTVLGLDDQLRQVILNLFLNAEDAMPGGGRMTVSTKSLPEAGEIRISVSDTGLGIDPAILPRIFEPFQSGKEKGTGLGLAICHEIIANHNGRIQPENRVEGGAAFHIWLPVPKEGAP